MNTMRLLLQKRPFLFASRVLFHRPDSFFVPDRFFDTCVHLALESRVDQSVSLPNKTLREQHKREVGSLSSVDRIGLFLSLPLSPTLSLSPLSVSLSVFLSLYLIFFILFYPCLKQIGLVLSKSGELAENAPWSQVKHYS